MLLPPMQTSIKVTMMLDNLPTEAEYRHGKLLAHVILRMLKGHVKLLIAKVCACAERIGDIANVLYSFSEGALPRVSLSTA
jgi:hypothetical protein